MKSSEVIKGDIIHAVDASVLRIPDSRYVSGTKSVIRALRGQDPPLYVIYNKWT